ncbi:MAG: hypothetical protein NVSMB46_04900 [Candidatus Saccharimonadales bacterium]
MKSKNKKDRAKRSRSHSHLFVITSIATVVLLIAGGSSYFLYARKQYLKSIPAPVDTGNDMAGMEMSVMSGDSSTPTTTEPLDQLYLDDLAYEAELKNSNSEHAQYQLAPVYYRVNTSQPVVFLTIDDGMVKDPAAISFMQQHNIVASLFLNDSKISDNYDYFRKLQSNGSIIQNHTVNHPDLTKLSFQAQKKEICDNADKFETIYGKRPTLFRPPYGAYNDLTRRAATACGMAAVVHWHAKANGGSMQYQQGNKLQPGDIVLMHFRKEVIADLTAFVTAAKQANLKPVLLENWIH